MLRNMLKSKIHGAIVTEANLAYKGSITIDSELMEASDIYEGEKVQVVNLNNGNRFETYVIAGTPGSKEICLNGGTARLGVVGDKVIIISYALFSKEELINYEPKVVMVS